MSIWPAIWWQQGVWLPSNPVLKKKPILKDQAGTPMQSTMDEPMQTPMPSSQQIKPTQWTAGQAQIWPSIWWQMPLINKPLIQWAPQTQATNFPEKVQQGIAQDIKVKQESRIPIEVSLSKSIADFSADIQKNGDISVEDINKFYPELKGREKSLADLSADIQKNGDISMEELQQYYPELLKAKETTIEGVYNKIKDKLAIAAPIVFPLTSLMLKWQEMAQEWLKWLTGKSTIWFVDPAFKYLSMDEINADNEKKIKDKDIWFVWQQMLKQSAPIEFMFENFGRLLNNVPSAVANTVIFATNILLDPETTIKEFVDGISALPAVVREQMSYADTTVDKIKTVVDWILWFVVENPDIIIAPEVLMKWSKLLKWRWPKMADISIQEEVLRRMKSKWMDVTPENVAKESNLLYDELMEESNKAPDAEQSDVDAYSNIYEWIDQKWELAQRPDIDYRTQIPTIEKDIQQIFWQTVVGVSKPTDLAKKTDSQISTIETILDNKDNLWDLFDTEGKVMKDMSVSMLAVWVQNTMDNFYQNFVTPIESSLSELKVKPSDTDIDWIIKSIDKSLDEMRIWWQVSPLAEKAFNVLSKYKEILSWPIQVSDLWKLSKELNQATKQLYGGATLWPATQILQSNLAGLNVIVRDIYEGVVSNILDVPELKTMKRQRWDMRNSIKQITRRGQVLDRKAPMTLVDSLWHAFWLWEIVIWALSQDPLLIVKWVALKAIVNHIKNLNSPNKQLYKLINKIDKSRNWFKVEWWFSEWSTAAEWMKRKMKKQVRKTQEEAAQKARMDKIQRDFANRMKQIQDTPALTVGVIEIMADGTIKQQAIAPKPRIQSVVEIDTVTPQKERQRLAAEKKIVDNEKSMIEAEKKMWEMAKQMIEKKEAMAQDMLYDYSAKNGTIVEWSDVFNWIKQWDVTKFGIVEKTVISGTKAQIYINWQTFMAWELGKVYRIANNPEKVLVKINNDIKQALDTNMTPATDEITEFLDGIWFNDPSQWAMVSMNWVDNFQTKAYSNAMTILEWIWINMEWLKPSKVINDMPRNLSEPIAKLVRWSYDNIDPALPEIKKMRDELNGNSDMEAGLKNMDEQSANEITARKDIDEVYKWEAKGFDDMMNEIDKKNIKELNEFKQQLEKDIDQPWVKDLIDEVNNDINKLEAKGLNDISEFYATNGISKLRQWSYNKYLSENEFKSWQWETLKERIDGISDLWEAQSYNEKEWWQSWAKIVFPDPEMPWRVTVITTNKYGKEYFDYVKNKYDPANTPKLETIKSKPKDLMDYAKKYKTYDKFYDAMLWTKSWRKMMNDINEYINGKDPELDIMDLKSDQLERFYKEATESKQWWLFDTTPQTDLMEEAPLPVSGSKWLKPKSSNLDIKQESAMVKAPDDTLIKEARKYKTETISAKDAVAKGMTEEQFVKANYNSNLYIGKSNKLDKNKKRIKIDIDNEKVIPIRNYFSPEYKDNTRKEIKKMEVDFSRKFSKGDIGEGDGIELFVYSKNYSKEVKLKAKETLAEIKKIEESMNKLPNVTLGDLLGNNSDAIKAYPEIKNTRVEFDFNLEDNFNGGVSDSITDGIRIHPRYLNKSSEDLKDIIRHETQHLIQNIEGWEKGTTYTSLEGRQEYLNHFGEIQARDELYKYNDFNEIIFKKTDSKSAVKKYWEETVKTTSQLRTEYQTAKWLKPKK